MMDKNIVIKRIQMFLLYEKKTIIVIYTDSFQTHCKVILKR